MAMSAAPPWIGVLMDARSACDLKASFLLEASGKLRTRPRRVRTRFFSTAIFFCTSCHSRTSGRSAYQSSTVLAASSRDVPQSFAKPCAVLPYAILKLSTLALRRSLANTSFTSAGRSFSSTVSSCSPYSKTTSPLSMASLMLEYIPSAVRLWKSPPASKASCIDLQSAMCAKRRSSS